MAQLCVPDHDHRAQSFAKRDALENERERQDADDVAPVEG